MRACVYGFVCLFWSADQEDKTRATCRRFGRVGLTVQDRIKRRFLCDWSCLSVCLLVCRPCLSALSVSLSVGLLVFLSLSCLCSCVCLLRLFVLFT